MPLKDLIINHPPGEVVIEVQGGECVLHFAPGASTGRDPEANPGVSFAFYSNSQLFPNRNATGFHGGKGVIGRADARALMKMLADFLAQHP